MSFDTTNSSTAMLPICLCLDNSPDLCEPPNDLIRWVYAELKNSLANTVNPTLVPEIAIVCCGGDGATLVLPFTDLNTPPQLPPLTNSGNSHLGQGVVLALEQLQRRISLYSQEELPTLPPRFILISHGYDTGNARLLRRVAAQVRRLAKRGSLYPYIIAAGPRHNAKVLILFAPRLPFFTACKRWFRVFTAETAAHLHTVSAWGKRCIRHLQHKWA